MLMHRAQQQKKQERIKAIVVLVSMLMFIGTMGYLFATNETMFSQRTLKAGDSVPFYKDFCESYEGGIAKWHAVYPMIGMKLEQQNDDIGDVVHCFISGYGSDDVHDPNNTKRPLFKQKVMMKNNGDIKELIKSVNEYVKEQSGYVPFVVLMTREEICGEVMFRATGHPEDTSSQLA